MAGGKLAAAMLAGVGDADGSDAATGVVVFDLVGSLRASLGTSLDVAAPIL